AAGGFGDDLAVGGFQTGRAAIFPWISSLAIGPAVADNHLVRLPTRDRNYRAQIASAAAASASELGSVITTVTGPPTAAGAPEFDVDVVHTGGNMDQGGSGRTEFLKEPETTATASGSGRARRTVANKVIAIR